MVRVGVAQLKASLSQYLSRVQAGETVIVTDHGRAVARLAPIACGDQEPDDRIRDLERLGVVRWSGGRLPATFWEMERPVDHAGQSLNLLLSERETGR